MKTLAGLTSVNVELTSTCNKLCHMCGRRERDKIYGDQNYGHMDICLAKHIADQIPSTVMVQLHNNGDPLCYPYIGRALDIFKKNTTNFVTNGKLLVKKSNEIINKVNSISISMFQGDTEHEEQWDIFQEFLLLKGEKLPFVILRAIGERYEKTEDDLWKARLEGMQTTGLPIAYRTLHLPKGSVGYKSEPMLPEHGICMDLLSKLAIDRFGNVRVCVRFDPDGELIIGNIQNELLIDIWNGDKRMSIVSKHVCGKRKDLSYCGTKCAFYGVPTK